MLQSTKELLISISGIRGTIGHGLKPQQIMEFLEAFCQITGKKIILGHDGRIPNPSWMKHLTISVLLARGKHIFDADLAPTPSIKCAACIKNMDAGIIITASHNPKHWNGFKFLTKNGEFFTTKNWQKWHKVLQKKESKQKFTLGSIELLDASKIHIENILQQLPVKAKVNTMRLPVVIDTICGAGSIAIPALLKELSCPLHAIYNYQCYDDVYPHNPEPSSLALKKLGKLLKTTNAGIGFGVDPDCDRLIVATPKRGVISEEYTLPLAVNGLLQLQNSNKDNIQLFGRQSAIAINFSTSSAINRNISSGGVPMSFNTLRVPVGEVNVVAAMRKNKIVMGGEGNGGVIYSGIPGFGRDPLVGISLILYAISCHVLRDVDALVDDIGPIHIMKKKFSLSSRKNIFSQKILDCCEQEMRIAYSQAKFDRRDGLFVDLLDGHWIHIRASNTEPIFRVIAEAENANSLRRIIRKSESILKKCKCS